MRTEKVVVEKYNTRWINEFFKLKLYFQKILGDRIIAYLLIYFQVKFGIIIFGLYRLFWYN